jgi:serine/threonine-protein kinase RsbW
VNAPLDDPDAAATDVVQVRIPAKAEWVAVARLAISAVASRLDFSVEDIEDVKLAIAEACTICIRRGAGGGAIEIVGETAADGLRLTVRSRSEARRPLAVADAEDALALVIVESLMDSVDVRTDGESVFIGMLKRVTSPA